MSEKKDATPINIPPYIEITCKMKDAKKRHNEDILLRFQFLLWCSKNILFIFQTPCLSVTTIWKGIGTQKKLQKTVPFLPSTEDPLFWKGAQFTEWETLIAEWWTRIPKRESWFRLTGSLFGEQVPQALHASIILA